MSRSLRFAARFCAIAAAVAIAGCAAKPPAPPPVLAPPVPEGPVAANPLDRDLPNYLRLPGMAPGVTPVRVGIILPFTSSSALSAGF